MRALDLAIIAIFLVGSPLLGIWLGGKQKSSADYFVGNRRVSWWLVTFSVVATETSTLTVISVPTVAYLGNVTYLQLAIGYLIGRVLVAFVLLPRYYSGNLVSAYGLLGQRFGKGMQGTASVTFLLTRLLADGVRLFATAIPVKMVLAALGLDVPYWVIIAAIALVAVIYTYLGGIKAVIWVDAIQMGIYILGAVAAVFFLAGKLPDGWFGSLADEGKFQFFDFTSNIVTNQYAFITAVVGGALFAMASHGADQLMVQRLLACKNVRDSQKAVVASGVVVFLQFALFLLVGAMLWAFYDGAAPESMGLSNNDELFPMFIVEQLPTGLSGLLIAGILAAAMSTISSSLNSLSTSTVSDIYQRVTKKELPDEVVLKQAKLWTLIWAVVFVVFASMFTSTDQPVVEVGLSIASYTYGALLGSFALGILVKRAQQSDAIIAFLCTIVVSAVMVLGVTFTVDGEDKSLAFPWYVPLGVVTTLVLGGLLSLRHRAPGPDELERVKETA
ncbi:sodium:solute symporter [Saccharomonospora viridis]|uniref:Na+/proline symporter n=1 Tax=Saccharomonospora viridis (strain ATCC 15386 / DSM 43017 / JCM 3036 / CCUG 5913 / NBRC 12207 / NCIMB 9602 / P101) TaxID=471857 RepID=C7MY68_SACVD|nr:sodium:solute symporter [Saccharomonospora viridis]ACU96016.1 Na+/proline symporter [Saccharomonospora viridis DSM 43017]